MRLFRFEFRKLLRLPMLWGFLALSLAFNGWLLMTGIHGSAWIGYVASVLPVTGQRTDSPAFQAGLETLPAEAFRESLREQTAEPQNVFDGLDTEALGEWEAGIFGITGRWKEIFLQKYRKLQPAADEIAASGAAYDVYAGEATYNYQMLLTGVVYHAALTEAILLAVLLTLYSICFETQYHTDLLVYSSRVGRAVQFPKISAALAASALCYFLLCACTLIPFAFVYHLRDFLRMSVSSSFHYVLVLTARVPFLTWKPFTLAEYLGATAALGFVLVLVFALGAAVIGLLFRNTYLSFLVWFVLSAGSMTLPVICGDAGFWGGYFLGKCLPVPVWSVQQEWFTVLGGSSFLPWQETVCTFGNLIFLTVLVILAARRFQKKDLT